MRLPAKIIASLAALVAVVFAAMSARADSPEAGRVFVQGIVVDYDTDQPLPYASVLVDGSSRGVVADDKGIFALTVPADAKTLQVTCMGYDKGVVELRRTSYNLYQVRLHPSTTELKEVVVRKQKYSKRNNPAVDFANRLREASRQTDPLRNPYYSYDRYEKITLGLNDFNVADTASFTSKHLSFLREYIDTSEVSGKTVLNLSVNEKVSRVFNRREPSTHREVVTGRRNNGFDEIVDKDALQVLYEDELREIDLYDNDIKILNNRFVSPLSRIAPDFYKFYLTDTVKVDGDSCIVLSFYPHNQAAFGFVGQVYVPVGDSTMFIRRVEMRAPKGINLNFLENLYISQNFVKAPDGSRLKTSDDLTFEAKILPGTQGLFARRSVAYTNHSFDEPNASDVIFSGIAETVTLDEATARSDEFWQNARRIEITHGEEALPRLMEKMRQNKLFYWTEKVLKVLVGGYVPTGKNSKFDVGPVNTMISFGDVEGLRLRLGGMTTANLSPHWFARGYVAYGTKDRKFKYMGELEYSFNRKRYHSREFPMHALRASYLYDLDLLGQHYLFTNQDNVFISLKRTKNNRVTYHRVGELRYLLELANNFSVQAWVRQERQEATPWVKFTNGLGETFAHYDETSFSVMLRYAPGERTMQAKSYRLAINRDAPVFVLEHTYAPKGFLGSMFEVNKTEVNVSKRFWFSAFGYMDVELGGGHVWSRSPYVNLMIPNANLSYIIEPQSYALMNAMEFINSSYASWFITYWANGAILNYIPGVKKLKLREVFGFRGLWGRLDKRDDPTYNSNLFVFPTDFSIGRMGSMPYMEASVGLDNIFKCLRVDYVWRLSHRHPAYPIDRSGVRIAMHFAF